MDNNERFRGRIVPEGENIREMPLKEGHEEEQKRIEQRLREVQHLPHEEAERLEARLEEIKKELESQKEQKPKSPFRPVVG